MEQKEKEVQLELLVTMVQKVILVIQEQTELQEAQVHEELQGEMDTMVPRENAEIQVPQDTMEEQEK